MCLALLDDVSPCRLLEDMEWSSLRWEEVGEEEAARIVNALCQTAWCASSRGDLSDALSLLNACQRFERHCTTLVPSTLQVHLPNPVCLRGAYLYENGFAIWCNVKGLCGVPIPISVHQQLVWIRDFGSL